MKKGAIMDMMLRSSRPEVFWKKSVLKNFAKYAGKHRCQSIFYNNFFEKFIKNETLEQMFSCEFGEIFKNKLFTEHLWATASGY